MQYGLPHCALVGAYEVSLSGTVAGGHLHWGHGCCKRVEWGVSPSYIFFKEINVFPRSQMSKVGRGMGWSLKRKETIPQGKKSPKDGWILLSHLLVYGLSTPAFLYKSDLPKRSFPWWIFTDLMILAMIICHDGSYSGNTLLKFPWESTCFLTPTGTWNIQRQWRKEHEE